MHVTCSEGPISPSQRSHRSDVATIVTCGTRGTDDDTSEPDSCGGLVWWEPTAESSDKGSSGCERSLGLDPNMVREDHRARWVLVAGPTFEASQGSPLVARGRGLELFGELRLETKSGVLDPI